jgi:DNA invertase Pin-like site-specific DNA recombinase
MGDTVRALGYVRVSTDEQAGSGLGLDAQRRKLRAEARARGWQLELVVDEGLSAKDLKRPALADALQRLDKRQADVLVVAKLDRLSRSVADFGGLLDRAGKRGWSVVCLDLGVDTTTPVGEFTANVVASASQYERRLIGQRTREALAERKAQGVRLGAVPVLPLEVVARVVREHDGGRSLAVIAAGLQADGVPTPRGGPWSRASVQSALRRRAEVAVQV